MTKPTNTNGWWSYIDSLESQEVLNPLAITFRKLCYDMGIITPLQYEELLQAYVERTIVDPKMRSGTKGNLKKAMHSPTMTINTFNECVAMLDADSVDITVTLKRGGKTYSANDERVMRRNKAVSTVLRRRINPDDVKDTE